MKVIESTVDFDYQVFLRAVFIPATLLFGLGLGARHVPSTSHKFPEIPSLKCTGLQIVLHSILHDTATKKTLPNTVHAVCILEVQRR